MTLLEAIKTIFAWAMLLALVVLITTPVVVILLWIVSP